MSKPIDTLKFWKDRIDAAKKEGPMHYSIYLKKTMSDIDARHHQIIQKLGINKQGVQVLDAGCGYGRNAKWFSEKNYVGIDFSPDFIDEAKIHFPDYDFHVVDLMIPLPFGEKQFDWAIFNSIRQMVEGNLGKEAWETMLENTKKVAKNVLILEYTTPEQYDIL